MPLNRNKKGRFALIEVLPLIHLAAIRVVISSIPYFGVTNASFFNDRSVIAK